MTQTARFEFGKNWQQFLSVLDEQRIQEAENSLCAMLEVSTLNGKSFLDVGSGSGLFSLAARRLGARVRSFDIDVQSVACTRELKQRYFPQDAEWLIEQGSILDASYLKTLETYDVVYSWGVLHHTGAMHQALENVVPPVKPGGQLFIAIYNDRGRASRMWRAIKRLYVRSPGMVKLLILGGAWTRLWGPACVRDVLRGRPFSTWRNYSTKRGMSAWYDLVDWVGGYPFEVAAPDEIFDFYRQRGFTMTRLITRLNSNGCNQFVFTKTHARPHSL